MGLFSTLRTTRRLEDLEEDCRKLKRNMESIELEWINFLDKAKRMLGRIAKRAETVQNAETEPAEVIPAAEDSRQGLFLSPRQRAIQQGILKRRAGGG